MAGGAKHLGRFWEGEWSLTLLLVWLVVSVFFILPLAGDSPLGRALVSVSFSLLLLTGVAAISSARVPVVITTVLVLSALSLRWLETYSHNEWIEFSSIGATILSMALFCGVVLARTFRRGDISLDRVQGAVVSYLLLGVIWALGYEMLQLLDPGAFRFPTGDSGAGSPPPSLVYFSFTTLTTLGYGDVLPVHPLAHSLSNLEALIGQLYPATFIARLVSLEIQERFGRRET